MKILFNISLVFTLVITSANVHAQHNNRYGKKHADLWPDELNYKLSGWYLSPGFTRMASKYIVIQDKNRPSPDGSSNYELTLAPKSKFGLYFEAGRYKIFKWGTLFKYMDYGIAYKSLRGTDTFSGVQRASDNTLLSQGGGTGTYGEHFIDLNINFNNIIQLSSYNFIQNSLGINADYAFIDNYSPSGAIPGLDMGYPGKLIAQLHYKFGFGFKLSNMMIIPSVETPILNAWPFQWDKSTLSYFYSKQRPLVFSVRFLFFNKKGLAKCIPVPAPDLPDGYKIPTDMEQTR
jgi:hypothetical protein